MIPKDSTPIKNKILIDIFAKGLLSKDEMRIIAYIIRWSWGFDNGERRQDWTKKIRITKIAKDINMDRGNCNRTILRMLRENKIKIKNSGYQFNEHYERWAKRVKTTRNKRVKTTRKTCKNYTKNVYKLHTKRVKITQLDVPNNQGESIKNKDIKGGEHMSKETLKENKKTIKENDDAQKKVNKICFNYNKGKFTGITEEYKSELRKQYPNCNIDRQFKRMANWLLDNPNKKRQGKRLFINNWLEKANSDYKKGDRNGKDKQNIGRSTKPGKDKYKHLEETYEV